MPYERDDVTFYTGIKVTGRVSKYGSRRLHAPERVEFDVLMPSQRDHLLCCRVTVYDPGDMPIGGNDYVAVTGLPDVGTKRLMLMAFGKDVEILNRWIPKRDLPKPGVVEPHTAEDIPFA